MQNILQLRIHDSHIHVGQFNDSYFTPESVLNFLDSVNVDYFAVSSTSVCGGNLGQMLDEIYEITTLSSHRALPVLWLTPPMFRENIQKVLISCGIDWKCVKIHGYHDWSTEYINQAVGVAKQLSVPILIHTGGRSCCDAGQYYTLCKNNSNQKFILAHGRPCDETIMIMEQCENVWTDTAFMPLEDVIKIVGCGFQDRILWGSDYPIPIMYKKGQNIKSLYEHKKEQLFKMAGLEAYNKICRSNFTSLFTLN
jgi:predicted TIM-barrel fold metal-dependent hydrolase